LFCSMPKVFFPRWPVFLFLLLCTAHPTTNGQHPLGSPALPATEDFLARTPETGTTLPAHVGARAPAATQQHTRSPPRTRHAQTVLPTPAMGHSPLVPSPPRPPAPTNTPSRRRPYRRRRQPAPPDARPEHMPPVLPTPAAQQKQVTVSLTRRPPQHAQPPPAIKTPAATRTARCPPRTRAAGFADNSG